MINKNTDLYSLAEYMSDWHKITERTALIVLGIKNISARISDLKKIGFPVETVLKVVTKRNGRKTKVVDFYTIKKNHIGKYKQLFKKI